jgi:6,7-dimethyl-8-ribityllumazine synthase
MARSEPAPPAIPLGDPSVRVAIAVAGFHKAIADNLLAGARARLAASGLPADQIDEVWVPGAFELPLAAKTLTDTAAYAAVLGLGCVIRGETAHFDYVCDACAHGLQRVSLDTGIPCTFGVLTCDTMAQAEARAGGDKGNKGDEAADAAVSMMNLIAAKRSAAL